MRSVLLLLDYWHRSQVSAWAHSAACCKGVLAHTQPLSQPCYWHQRGGRKDQVLESYRLWGPMKSDVCAEICSRQPTVAQPWLSRHAVIILQGPFDPSTLANATMVLFTICSSVCVCEREKGRVGEKLIMAEIRQALPFEKTEYSKNINLISL